MEATTIGAIDRAISIGNVLICFDELYIRIIDDYENLLIFVKLPNVWAIYDYTDDGDLLNQSISANYDEFLY